MAMGVHDVIRTEDTGQSSAHHGLVEDFLESGDFRQNIVPRIALRGEYFVGLPIDLPMECGRQFGLQGNISVDDEVHHRPIIEEVFLVHHVAIFPIVLETRAG